MVMTQRVDHAVTHIATGMATLSTIMADPSTVAFDDVAAGARIRRRTQPPDDNEDAA